MMKAAIVNFGPGGSTGRIGCSLYDALTERKIHSLFCYGYDNDCERLPPDNHYKIGNRLDHKLHFIFSTYFGLQGYFSLISTLLLIRCLKQENIDTVFLIDIHGSYLNEWVLFHFFKRHRIKIVYIMIDEYAMLGHCCYSYDCKKYIEGCGLCIRNNAPTNKRLNLSLFTSSLKRLSYKDLKHIVFIGPECVIAKARESHLLKGKKLIVMDEAIDVSLFSPRNISETKEKLNLPKDKVIILCAAPMSDIRKGCKYFLEVAKKMEQNDKYIFIHIGCDDSTICYPKNYIPIPFMRDQNLLADYLSCADLFVFPSLADSMPSVCLDALACGTPLLCFDLPGMTCLGDESVLTVVTPRDTDALKSAIIQTNKKEEFFIKHCREYALNRYDSKKYNQSIITLAQGL